MYFLVKMQNTRTMSVKQVSRYIFTCSTNYSMSREGKFLNKLIKQGQSNRDSIECLTNLSPNGNFKKQLSGHTVRRMNVLNKVFMEHITDLMSTGEIEPEILNRGIEISHVKITANFKCINVHWIDNSTDKKSDTEELLQKCAYQLRHELSQLRVMGSVPPIQFVKCKGINVVKEVEQKLKALGFEGNYMSNFYSNVKHHTVSALDSSDNCEKIQNDESSQTSEENFSVTIPVMDHDVFELDHFRMMSKIKVLIQKSRKALKKEIKKMELDQSFSSELDIQNSFLTNDKQQEQFKKFIHQRRKEQRKKLSKRRSNIDASIYALEEKDSDDDEEDVDYNNFDDYYNDNCNNDDDEYH